MLNFSLPVFYVVLLFASTITTVQPYNATDRFFIACGSPSTITTDRRWDGDQNSRFVPSNINTISFPSSPFQPDSSLFGKIPYSFARVFNTSSFTYTFPVSEGPKFLRLYFYPAIYSGLNPNQSFFSVSSNGFSLLTNFSAFLTASFLERKSFVKEYIIHVKDTQFLNVTFTPSPNSYAFINGIEIVSMPEDLYFNSNVKLVGTGTGPPVTNEVALENMYRLNVGGKLVPANEDTGMYRTWDRDDDYIFGAAIGWRAYYGPKPIMYTKETPNYTAPELVYQTQRSMGNQSDLYNLTWILPVDSGFYYNLRLHFCNIRPEYNKSGQVVFRILINNQTAEDQFDVFDLVRDSRYPVFQDYVVFVGGSDGSRGKQYLWVAMQPNKDISEYFFDAFLNGLEAFKQSMNRNLTGPNPELSFTTPPTGQTTTDKRNKKKHPYAAIIGGIGGTLVVLAILVLIVQKKRRRVRHYGATKEKSSHGPAYNESKSSHYSTLPSDRCRRFSLTEVKAATGEFNDDFVIGIGGFGKVYKGNLNDSATPVAIKRLNESSNQGFLEFHTEIGMLSKLRHVQLVSLIGYCDDEGEMILVYDYMAHGTLREHLYKTNNPPLSWKRRLQICIGAAKGLHYLHTGAKRAIIHRDVKSTNILLDENWVAKVSDFGLSKLGPRDQAQNHVSTVVKGSIGYVDPEYYRSQQLTDKSDVYSFGVVLLEVLCARPVMIQALPKEQVSLAEWGKSCYQKGTLNEIIDPQLRNMIAPECLKQFGVVAVSCLKQKGIERPTMDEVVWGLEFALELQEAADKTFGEAVLENQELPILRQGGTTTADDDDSMFTGSSGTKHGTSSTSSSDAGFKSNTVFSEILKPTGR